MEKGLIEAQRNLLYYSAQHQGVHETLRKILAEDDFTEDVFRRAFHHIGELWSSSGHVFPADLVSRFEETKEQKFLPCSCLQKTGQIWKKPSMNR